MPTDLYNPLPWCTFDGCPHFQTGIIFCYSYIWIPWYFHQAAVGFSPNKTIFRHICRADPCALCPRIPTKGWMFCSMSLGMDCLAPRDLSTRDMKQWDITWEHHGENMAGWWLGHPSEKYEFVNWDDEIPNINGKIKKWQPNHQPDGDFYSQCMYDKSL